MINLGHQSSRGQKVEVKDRFGGLAKASLRLPWVE